MGIVQRESIRSTIISYAGAILGFGNLILITNTASQSLVGFTNVILLFAIGFANLSSFGTGNVLLRFFPFLRRDKENYSGSLFGVWLISTIGFVLFSILFFLFKDEFTRIFTKNDSPLLAKYIIYAIPLAYSWVIFILIDAFLRSLYKTVVVTLIKDVFKRLGLTILLLLLGFEVLDQTTFIYSFIAFNLLLPIPLIIYLIWLKELKIKPKFGFAWKRLGKTMFWYGFFTFITYCSSLLPGYIDNIFVSGMEGEAQAGIFAILFNIATLVAIPWRSIARVTAPLVAQYWRDNDIPKLQQTFRQTSLINLIVGGIGLILMWENRNFLFWVLGDGYEAGKWVLLIIGIGRVFDMWMGLNVYILMLSKKYVYDVASNLIMLITGLLLNYYLIKAHGILGAAIATLSTIVIFNIVRLVLVQYFYKIHPFSWRMVSAFVILGLCWGLSAIIPFMYHPFLDSVIRSTLILGISVTLLLKFKVSPEINDYLVKVSKKLPFNIPFI